LDLNAGRSVSTRGNKSAAKFGRHDDLGALTGSVKGASTRNSNEFRMPRREAKGAA